MNLRCLYCQTPFTLSRVEMITAIVNMNEKNLSHYDAHCPRCRRANSISRQRMELFLPNWREAAKQLEALSAAPPADSQKTLPLPKSVKQAVLQTAPVKAGAAAAAKPSAAKRQRAGTSAAVKKTAPAVKSSTAKKPADSKPAAKTPSKPKKSSKEK